jgi:hypothetical protein
MAAKSEINRSIARPLLEWLSSLGSDGVSTNTQLPGVAKQATEELDLSEADLVPVLEALQGAGFITRRRPGYSGIFDTAITNSGRDYLTETLSAEDSRLDSGHSLVFISCGQQHPHEIELGKKVAAFVDSLPGFTAYLASSVTSLDALTNHILKRLNDCVAYIAILHDRGDVRYDEASKPFKRGSIWIEQEIAIASFLVQVSGKDILPLLYVQRGIQLEGLRKYIILNYEQFDSDSEVLDHLRKAGIGQLKQVRAAKTLTDYSQQVRITTSPLDPKPYPIVSLENASTNPDFVVGAQIWPYSYSVTRRILDADDIAELGRIVDRALSVLGASYKLVAEPHASGALFTSPRPIGRRADGAPMQADTQIFIYSDGEMTIRLAQSDQSPFEQIEGLLLIAYRLICAVFSLFGLEQRANVRLRLNLDARRNAFKPIISGSYDGAVEIQTDSFSDAFTDLVLMLLGASGQTAKRKDVQEMLGAFFKETGGLT